MFGRLEPYKGLSTLIAAMEIVWQRREVGLLVAGTGPLAALVRRDSRIELQERYVPEAELDELFSRTTVMALPYIDATQSGAGLEAMRRGVPIVASDAGALADLVDDPRLVVPTDNPESLAAALLLMLDHDASHRMRVLDWTARKFGWDATVEQFADSYRHAIAKRDAG
jgi:glycosyltransferase involved in cell wall biosynthesis